MPTMASITVKKFDGTTDIVYDQLASSGGDTSPAVWRQDTGVAAAIPQGLRKLFKLLTRWNGPRTARLAEVEFHFPYAVLDTTTSLYSSKDKAMFKGVMTCPQAMPLSEINEACYQFGNLMAATLVKQSVASGYAPN